MPARIADGFAPRVSHDGRSVLCIERSAAGDSLVITPIPMGFPRRYTRPKGARSEAAEFTRRSDQFLIQVSGVEDNLRTYLFRTDSTKLEPIGNVPFVTLLAPDGDWGVAPAGDELRSANVRSGETRSICRLRPGWAPLRWSNVQDRSVFAFEPGSDYATGQITRVDLSSGDAHPVAKLNPSDQVGVYVQPWADITPDGTHYAYTFQRDLLDLYVVDGLV